MLDPYAVNTNSRRLDDVESSSDDEDSLADPQLASQSRETPNFSRPLPLSPPGSLRSADLSKSTVADTAQVANPNASSPRPLPAVPGLAHVYPSRSLENIQGGRGSGLGTRIIDDRDSDEFVIASPPPLSSQIPSRKYEEDGQTSTAGASDSELLYASAPSTPLRVANDLEEDEFERGGAVATRHERPDRRATITSGESRHDHRQDSMMPKRAATTDYYGRGDQGIPVSDTRVQKAPRHQPDDDTEEDLEYADKLDPYLRGVIDRFGKGPPFPEPLVQGRLAGAPTFPQPQHQSQPIVLGLSGHEPYDSSPSLHHKVTHTALPPTRSQEQVDNAWKSYSSPTLHARQASGAQSVSSDTSQFPPPVIAGTNLQFEPLPLLQRTASGVTQLTHGEGEGHPHKSNRLPALSPNRERPGAFPGEVSHPSAWAVQDHDSRAGADTIQGDTHDLPIPSTSVTSVSPLRILKHTQNPTHPLNIPPGAAVPTPPGSPPSESPQRRKQSSDTKAPAPEVSIPSLPASQAREPTFLGSNTAIETPRNLNSVPPDVNIGVTKQASNPANIISQMSTSREPGDVKLNAEPSSYLNAPGPVPIPSGPSKFLSKKDVNLGSHTQDLATDRSEPAGTSSVKKERQVPLERGNGSTDHRDRASEAQGQPQPGGDQSQSSQSRSQQATRIRQSHPPPPEPQRRPPHSDTDTTPTVSPTRQRHAHGDSLSSQQPRTLAEEKAQYSAVPPASRSKYMNMLLALDDIPTIYNLLASFFTWILLAGFVLFPGTFSTLQTIDLGNGVGAALIHRIVNIPLFIIAFLCTGIGIIGMLYLWWRWMKNYIWLVNKIFLPGLMNALAGILSTIVNIYGVQHGIFNTSSIITISVNGGVAVVCGVLTLWYGVWRLGRVKRQHVKEVGLEKAGKHGEGVWAGFKARIGKQT